jgi:hypothetical protein
MRLVIGLVTAFIALTVLGTAIEAKRAHGREYYRIMAKFYRLRHQNAYAQASDQPWLYAPWDVYFGSRWVGRDPDPQVRLNIARDWAPRNR